MKRLFATVCALALLAVLVCAPAGAQQKKQITLWLIGDAQTGSYAQVYNQI